MPRSGFKSYSIKEDLYEIIKKEFNENRHELRLQGITSISAYFSYLINKNIEESDSKASKRFSLIKIIANKVIVKDSVPDRVIELTINQGKIYCEQDKKTDCIHVGFAYSLSEIYKLLK